MKKSKLITIFVAAMVFITAVLAMSTTVFATTPEEDAATAAVSVEEGKEETDDSVGTKAIAAAIVVGLASAVGAVAMGMAISKSAESMARQPEAAGKINSAMMLGLVFIETLIIYALIVAILIIFVL